MEDGRLEGWKMEEGKGEGKGGRMEDGRMGGR